MTTHRSWFPFILIGLTTALLALVLVAYDKGVQRADDAPDIFVPTSEEYEAAVRAVVTTYMTLPEGEADKAAYDALIAMRVPSREYQALHIDLVIAFGQFVAGEDERGSARLFDIQKNYPWVFGP